MNLSKQRTSGWVNLLGCLLLAGLVSACGKDKKSTDSAALSASAEAQASAAASPAGLASGQDGGLLPATAIYQTACAACHTDGVAGAPRFGNREDWKPRIEKGEDALMQSVINGKGSMPVKGTVLDASEQELRATVQYMVQGSQ